MSGDNFSIGVPKTRGVLEDLTNRPVRRKFSLISDGLGHKSGDGHGENVGKETEDSRFPKQVCVDLMKEKCKTKLGVDIGNLEKKQHCKVSHEKILSLDSRDQIEIKESELVCDSLELVKGCASRDSCASSGSIATSSGQSKKRSDEEVGLTSDATTSNLIRQWFTTVHSGPGDLKDHSVVNLATSNCDSVEWSKLPESQESISFGFTRCTTLKSDDYANPSKGADLLKACSCSCCLKAAYMWSDLHYQDIKGRIAVLRKSQKEASIMINKFSKGKQSDAQGQGKSRKSVKLESDLTDQWRSLFHYMDGIFGHESNQLEAKFVSLRDLRETCKTDLERITGLPSDKT
ncbi:hypothetical protein K2173_014634 [Erythroxylum novogranatense]|uniref:Uncharacterized protein n=1 Tax=Erythroxylum novogranatense TaxID=1862640 RepID=A0AAV8TFD7_9ROSI|nr:hypothetical protein K2173_014634 [Erythroxylum novogranatense]